jgi:hypothetical protein
LQQQVLVQVRLHEELGQEQLSEQEQEQGQQVQL